MGFKKIASVLASTFLVGSTIFAGSVAAAMYPQPFVSSNGAANVAIVYGSHTAATSDLVSVTAIQTDLGEYVLEDAVSGSASDASGGEFIVLEKSNDKFNLGNTASTLFSTAIDSETQDGAMSEVLADGIYENDDRDEFDYEQEIKVGALQMTHFADNDFNDEEPVIGFSLADGTTLLNYTLEFTPDSAEGGTDWVDLESTTINMLGKSYYILTATNTSTITLELLDSANDGQVNEGETVTVVAGDTTYEVSASVFSADEVVLTVNGESTDGLDEGQTEKLADGTYVGVKDIRYISKESGVSQVTFSIGSGKIKLVHGDEIQVNNEDISDLSDFVINSYITQTNGELEKIVLEWQTDEEMWLGYGTDSTELTMPAFETIKLSLGEWTTDADEMTSVTPDGDDKFKLDTVVTDGSVGFNFLYTNTTDILGLGKDADELLLTNSSSNPVFTFDMDDHSWFVATWVSGDDHESYVLEVSDIDDASAADNRTTIRSVASGSNKAVNLDIGDTGEIGELAFTLQTADPDTKAARFQVTAAGGTGTVYGDRLISAEGLKIKLPYRVANGIAVGDGGLNFTNSITSFTMNFTEETKDGDINEGSSFTAVLGLAGGETTVSSISVTDYETSDGSDDFAGHVQSDLATRTLLKTGGDQDELDITYYGTESYGELLIAQTGVMFGEGDGSNAIGVPLKDTEIASASGKNIIVVGGSCVNTVAAELLGGTDRFCGDAWTTATTLGQDKFLIKTFSRTGGNVATLVAGWSAVDTQNAATALTTQDVDTTVGMAYTGSTADSIESL